MRPLRPPAATFAVAGAVVVILALSEAAQVYLGLSLLGGGVPWTVAFRATAPSWAVLFLLVAPLLVWLERSPVPATHPRRLAAHALAGTAFVVLHLGGTALLGEWLAPEPVGYRAGFFQLATVYFVPDFLTYVAVVGAHHAVRRDMDDRRREVQAARLLAHASEARFLALQGRLRPDFFFNTLNAVTGLLMRGDATRGVDTLVAFSELLRACLAVRPGSPVPVADEVRRVEAYLAIQRTRFAGRFGASVEVAPESTGRAVPALVLLQVVEGVVDHALAAGTPFLLRVVVDDDRSRIRVRAELDGTAMEGVCVDGLRDILGRGASPGRVALDMDGAALLLRMDAHPVFRAATETTA